MADVPVLPLTCAYWTREGLICRNPGLKACGNCKLVVYCGTACQKLHWADHKKQCKSSMAKPGWRPAWDREGREPRWATDAVASRRWHNPFGGTKYLWGNTPAVDIIQLEKNEGLEYREEMSLLFAASGDLRHVVKSISDLPDTASQPFNIVLNDIEFDVVARNAILLLLALEVAQRQSTCEGTDIVSSAVESMIHVWYSAYIPQVALTQLQVRVEPLVSAVCEQIATKDPEAYLGKTWKFQPGRSLRLVLKQKHWLRLREYLIAPVNLEAEEARRKRLAVTLAPERKDYQDRWYFKDASPFMRIAKERFREDGLLLPFGHPRLGFDIPNPTLFLSKTWPLDDKASPVNGWAISAIQRSSSLASGDWYGKLYAYLSIVLKRFIERLGNLPISFTLFNVDIQDLPRHLDDHKYSRIEVSNVCDGGYIGIRKTIALLSPYLERTEQNPHATLVTLFINATKEAMKASGATSEKPNIDFLSRYIPMPAVPPMPLPNGADLTRLWDARDLAADAEAFFQKYMKMLDFTDICDTFGVKVKPENTIVEKWPTRLRLRPGDKGAEEEFWLLFGSDFNNVERYVEWRRATLT